MRKWIFETVTGWIFIVSCCVFTYHSAITENTNRMIFWGVVLLLNYVQGSIDDIKDEKQ
jgi:quinol-cytochrome oxidoreductase complex cytochrome b subunit